MDTPLASVTSLTGGQEMRISIWPEPGEDLVVVTSRTRWWGFALAVPRPARRWEVVARWVQPGSAVHHHVIPASEGTALRWTWVGARWSAYSWNRRERRNNPVYLPPARWVVRRHR